MNRQTFRTSIFITAMLAASAAFAGADIVKCVDQDGRVTLTDAQCSEACRRCWWRAPRMTPADAGGDRCRACEPCCRAGGGAGRAGCAPPVDRAHRAGAMRN